MERNRYSFQRSKYVTVKRSQKIKENKEHSPEKWFKYNILTSFYRDINFLILSYSAASHQARLSQK